MSPARLQPRPEVYGPRWVLTVSRSFPRSFWAITAYIFFEYVRPQTIYPWLDFLPWATLALALAAITALTESNGKRRWSILDTGILSYTIVLLISIPLAFDPAFAYQELGLYLNWLLVYAILVATLNSRNRVAVFLLFYFLWNLKMTSHAVRSWAAIGFAFRDIGTGGAPGWFQNSGEFGIQMCVVMPLSLYFALAVRDRVSKTAFLLLLVLPSTAVLGAIASSSRGALLGVGAVILWAVLRSKHKIRALAVTVVLSFVTVVLVPPEQKDRFSESGSDRTSVSRLIYWERGVEIANRHPVLGVGYANWLPYYRSHYDGWVQLSHNIFVQCMSELGYTGLAALAFLIYGTFRANAKTRKLAARLREDARFFTFVALGLDGALVGFLVSGFFVTVLYYPYFWVNLGMTAALHGAARLESKRRHQGLHARTPGRRAVQHLSPAGLA